MPEPQITVICLTYNHEKYIADALDGILSQQVNVPVEILVHDDASTDKTQEIVRDYDRRYPGRFTLVFQQENQYSKGKRPTPPMLDLARGKYAAVCEGDDYWTDPHKLQKQYDAMEAHPELDICAHTVRLEIGGKLRMRKPKERTSRIFTLDEMIQNGGGHVATCSLFLRRSAAINRPEFYECLPVDYTLQIMGALRGGLLFLRDEMGVYRYQLPSAWTKTVAGDRERYSQFTFKLCRALEIFDRETDGAHLSAVRLALYRYYSRLSELVPENSSYLLTLSRIKKELFLSQKVSLAKKSIRRSFVSFVKRSLRIMKS